MPGAGPRRATGAGLLDSARAKRSFAHPLGCGGVARRARGATAERSARHLRVGEALERLGNRDPSSGASLRGGATLVSAMCAQYRGWQGRGDPPLRHRRRRAWWSPSARARRRSWTGASSDELHLAHARWVLTEDREITARVFFRRPRSSLWRQETASCSRAALAFAHWLLRDGELPEVLEWLSRAPAPSNDLTVRARIAAPGGRADRRQRESCSRAEAPLQEERACAPERRFAHTRLGFRTSKLEFRRTRREAR